MISGSWKTNHLSGGGALAICDEVACAVSELERLVEKLGKVAGDREGTLKIKRQMSSLVDDLGGFLRELEDFD